MGAVCTKAGREEAAFLKAAKDGDCQAVQRAILRHVEWTYKTQTWNGQTVFHLAARHGRLDVLVTVVEAVRFNPAGPEVWRKLLRLGHSTDAILRSLVRLQDARCQTALHLACIYGHADVAEQLLRLGATPWAWDELGGRTPLHYAASMGHVDVIRVVLSHNAPQPQPGGADGEVLRPPNNPRTRLVDVCNDSGYTPLHYAVWASNADSIRALTSFDASLAARNVAAGNDWIVSCVKCTPLHLAAHRGNLAAVKLIMSAYVQGQAPTTADSAVNTSDRRRRDPRRHVNADRQLPYHMAIARNFIELAQMLHPEVPLSFILTPAELQATERLYGAPRLAVIAAKALQAKLVAEIEASVTAMKATSARTGSIGIAGSSRTRSGSLAALSGAVAAAAAAAGPSAATAQQVLAAAAAKLRERSIDAGSAAAAGAAKLRERSVDAGSAAAAAEGGAAAGAAAGGSSRPASRHAAAVAAAAAALLLPAGLQSQTGEAMRLWSAGPSLDSTAAAAVSAAAGKTSSMTSTNGGNAAAAAAAAAGGSSSTATHRSTGGPVAVAATTSAATATGAGMAAASAAPRSTGGSSGGESEHEALAVDPLSDLPMPRPMRQTSLPLPPAPISPFLPSTPHTGAGGTAAGTPTFNAAASAFALFAAEPFEEHAAERAGQQLHLDGTASVSLATLAHSRWRNGGGAGAAAAVAGSGGGGAGGGEGRGGRPLEVTGNVSVTLAALARNRGGVEGRASGGTGGGAGSNKPSASRPRGLRSILAGRQRNAATQGGAAAPSQQPQRGEQQRGEQQPAEQQLGTLEPRDEDDLDDILNSMQPPEEAEAATAAAAAAAAAEDAGGGNAAAAALGAAVAAAAASGGSGGPSTPPSAAAAPATPRSRGGTLAFWRRATSSTGVTELRASLEHARTLMTGVGATPPSQARPGRTSSGGFRSGRTPVAGIRHGRTSSSGVRDLQLRTSNNGAASSPHAGTPSGAAAAAAAGGSLSASTTPHAVSSTGRARKSFLSPFAAAAANFSAPSSPAPAPAAGNHTAAAAAGRPSVEPTRASPFSDAAYTPAGSPPAAANGDPKPPPLSNPPLDAPSAFAAVTAVPTTTALDSTADMAMDRAHRLLSRSSISLAVLARNPAAAAPPPPEAAEPPVDRAVLAMLASLVEAPQQVLRRYRLLQLTHGLDLHDLLLDHSEAAAAATAAAAGDAAGCEGTGGMEGSAAADANVQGLLGDGPAAAKAAVVSALTRTASNANALPNSGSHVAAPSAAGIVGLERSGAGEGVAVSPTTAAATSNGGAAGGGAGVCALASSGMLRRSVGHRPEPMVPALSLGRSGLDGILDDSIVAAAIAAAATAPATAGTSSSVTATAAAATNSPVVVTSARCPGSPIRISVELHGGGKADIAAGGGPVARSSVGMSSYASAAVAAAAAGTVGSGASGGAAANANAASASLAGHLLRTLSSQAASESGEGVCGVCFDLPDNLTITSCGHRLCADCSRELCKLNAFKPALCPFCRGFIGGFKFAGR